jgi:hypothetical protein
MDFAPDPVWIIAFLVIGFVGAWLTQRRKKRGG